VSEDRENVLKFKRSAGGTRASQCARSPPCVNHQGFLRTGL